MNILDSEREWKCKSKFTNIRITGVTRKRICDISAKGDSYDSVINKLINYFLKDSEQDDTK